ncbi:unnamed protein product, partial [Chrysoparadoxa australica]
APRIGGSHLQAFVNRNVTIVGRVISQSPELHVLEAADGQKINIEPSAGSTYDSAYVELVGHVHEDLHVQEFISRSYGNNFDLEKYNSLLQLIHGEYAPLFMATD